jgi:hypothetical protein
MDDGDHTRSLVEKLGAGEHVTVVSEHDPRTDGCATRSGHLESHDRREHVVRDVRGVSLLGGRQHPLANIPSPGVAPHAEGEQRAGGGDRSTRRGGDDEPPGRLRRPAPAFGYRRGRMSRWRWTTVAGRPSHLGWMSPEAIVRWERPSGRWPGFGVLIEAHAERIVRPSPESAAAATRPRPTFSDDSP